jgi:hypothetical protein
MLKSVNQDSNTVFRVPALNTRAPQRVLRLSRQASSSFSIAHFAGIFLWKVIFKFLIFQMSEATGQKYKVQLD